MLSKLSKKTAVPAGAKNFLGTIDLFKNVPTLELVDIEKKAVEKKYNKGQTIFLEGDPAESVWFVKEGHVKAMSHSAKGRDQTLCMTGAGKMFGTCCCFGGGEYPCHSVAETDVTIISVPLKDFTGLLEKQPKISTALITQLSQRLRQSKDTQTFEQENVEKRILHVLMDLAKEFGNTIPLTRREIAEMAGTTVETSIRTFSKLEMEGLVSSSRGKITLRSAQHLKERLEEL